MIVKTKAEYLTEGCESTDWRGFDTYHLRIPWQGTPEEFAIPLLNGKEVIVASIPTTYEAKIQALKEFAEELGLAPERIWARDSRFCGDILGGRSKVPNDTHDGFIFERPKEPTKQ